MYHFEDDAAEVDEISVLPFPPATSLGAWAYGRVNQVVAAVVC